MDVLSVARWGSKSWELAEACPNFGTIYQASTQRMGTGRMETRAFYPLAWSSRRLMCIPLVELGQFGLINRLVGMLQGTSKYLRVRNVCVPVVRITMITRITLQSPGGPHRRQRHNTNFMNWERRMQLANFLQKRADLLPAEPVLQREARQLILWYPPFYGGGAELVRHQLGLRATK